jgi:nicotinic acid mononucleotide adenylyltransferase
MPSMDISSSAIRKMLSEGRKPEGLIPENVYDYIVSNNLYKAKV